MKNTEIEETHQSIADTLKRSEKILIDQERRTELSIKIPDGKKGEKWKEI